MIILGIDPGLASTGFGVIEADIEGGVNKWIDSGIIQTSATTPVQKRLVEIYGDMRALLAKHKPDLLGIERLFVHANRSTVVQVAQARGVVLFACKDIEMMEIVPTSVKNLVASTGRATKKEIANAVQRLLKIPPIKDDNAADALAIAIGAAMLMKELPSLPV
jgi:crossover junction endodeoxyribonuclease RuvC